MSSAPALLTIQQKLLLDHLRHTRGSPLSVERLVAVLYGSRADGGPDQANKVVTVQMAKLRQWLPMKNEVLAFTQAPATQGGGGALLVLLRG